MENSPPLSGQDISKRPSPNKLTCANTRSMQASPDAEKFSPRRKNPGSTQKLKTFFQELQRDSRHALTNKKAKLIQLLEGRKWRRMSVEEGEPFADMEEREMTSYGATEMAEYTSIKSTETVNGEKQECCTVENRC